MKSFFIAAVSMVVFASGKEAHHKLTVGSPEYHESWVERKYDASSAKAHELEHTQRTVEHGRRPVVGILTEPLRGDMSSKAEEADSSTQSSGSYIPKSHVQFLEQAGIRVVPVDYRMAPEDQIELMNKLNGLYVPGDSHLAVTDKVYISAFNNVMNYTNDQVQSFKEHFPVFMMGNAMQTLVHTMTRKSKFLSSMEEFRGKCYEISLVGKPDDHYLINGIEREEYQAMFNVAKFLNLQSSGLRLKELLKDPKVSKHLKAVATYDMDIEDAEEQFIAIAEGVNIPLYVFTYQVEMVQFYFEDPSETLDEFLLDHSLIARKHAQAVASVIADESRLSSHKFDDPEEIFDNLVRHQKLVTVTYQPTTNIGDELSMPTGMTSHDVYMLQ